MLSVALLLTLSCVFTACSSDPDPEENITQDENNKGGNQGNNQNEDQGGGTYTGTTNGHDYVDLGLPSGTKWATCNVGASKPEDSGGYYAWGETAAKSDYSWDTYKYGTSNVDVQNLGSNIAGTKYDVAYVEWGGGWRMPTLEQLNELYDNTTSEWVTQKGVKGRKFTSKKNGGSIFIPAVGSMYASQLEDDGVCGAYWLSVPHKKKSGEAYVMCFDNETIYEDNYDYYCNGLNVRAVINDTGNSTTPDVNADYSQLIPGFWANTAVPDKDEILRIDNPNLSTIYYSYYQSGTQVGANGTYSLSGNILTANYTNVQAYDTKLNPTTLKGFTHEQPRTVKYSIIFCDGHALVLKDENGETFNYEKFEDADDDSSQTEEDKQTFQVIPGFWANTALRNKEEILRIDNPNSSTIHYSYYQSGSQVGAYGTYSLSGNILTANYTNVQAYDTKLNPTTLKGFTHEQPRTVKYSIIFCDGHALVLKDENGETFNYEKFEDADDDSSQTEVKKQTFQVNGVNFVMVSISGGTFQMGSKTSYTDDDKPVHKVTLSDFSIGQTEVTQELWEAVMGHNPSNFKGAKLPVEKVSWNYCQTFITKLNELTGQKFRLPTEAEWEFAARGGNNSMGYWYAGSNHLYCVAWSIGNSDKTTHEVATKYPNELGLYDMTGNVWEWCQDWYSDSYYSSSVQTNPKGPDSGSKRVCRGGSFADLGECAPVPNRGRSAPTQAAYYMGLRLAL